MKFFDISQPVFGCRIYKGDTTASYDTRKNISEGYRLTDVTMSLHNGTHIDAPSHYIATGKDISSISLDACFGKCTVAKLGKVLDARTSENFCGVERLLICGTLDADGAKSLIDCGVKLIGVDSQSVASVDCETQVHTILLQAGVVILEGLNLDGVEDGEYTLVAFPLNFNGLEASPVRAVLIKQ